MYCPVCGAEYRPGFTVCSDCQVALVTDPLAASMPNQSIENASGDQPFTLVWSGNDSRIHAEICESLDAQKIPARTLGSEDHLFNLSTRPAFEVYVPTQLVNSAREAIKQVDALEESAAPSESDILELPAEDDAPDETAYEEEKDERAGRITRDPQDATVEVWSGQNRELAAMIASSLRENDILSRSDPDLAEPQDASDELRDTRLLVFPEDETRAKEIVREIVDAAPPE
jgi:hypothetical protein